MHGGGYPEQTWGYVLGSCSKTLIAIKNLASSGGGPTEGASCEDLERVIIDTDPEKFFQVGAQLLTLEKQALIKFL